MDRLTKQINGEACHYDCNGPCGTCDGCTCFAIGQMVDRLAAYEDICYSEDGTERISLDRLRALAKADRDGRCVVLPVPFGRGKEAYVIASDDLDDGVPKEIVTLDCEEIENLSIWPSGEMVATVDGWEVGNSDICKTAFLTRAEAEAALAGEENEP